MFAFLKGKVITKHGSELFIDVNGLGFAVVVPVDLFCNIQEGQELFLWIRSFFREREKDFIHYGFRKREELLLFNRLIKVPSVGPQVAMSIISHLGYRRFLQVIENGDLNALKAVPKVGAKTAKRIAAELGKELLVAEEPSVFASVVEALVSLGYTREEASKVLSQVEVEEGDTEEVILTKALKKLGEIR
ncbi:Holliday junction DNA helicase RuvA [Thermosulfidibacter takaii ABI70S6]|uniref:Holliday junction branch migration complex subunit RuvA n=1 Tax=Thermosulfidibacter takaii (strain DSM 17441 / JCM 13301 / NBRC 103674 / ABI70S6) TaxID=1298851 RepID=A0A0S3QS16_THET7|nr:Holliday junction branch migration protein RuvA [Thermosulfidibacter takaii]BAT71116.1 Holliday junction DNA helicase RuvA [Thermosulfidibacter takaii ABI70S6]